MLVLLLPMLRLLEAGGATLLLIKMPPRQVLPPPCLLLLGTELAMRVSVGGTFNQKKDNAAKRAK